jgi:multiple sugar transport system ATP-binding protein
MARVELRNVTKKFGSTMIIDRCSLAIEDREFLVLVGPSGCGKSTLLRMVAGLEEITEGSISIDGQVVNDAPPKDRGIAMVFQNYALYPHMNVRQNMSFGLRMQKFSAVEIDVRVREAARILELEHLLDRKPSQLSGGQRQRVAMGRAIVRKPKVFLFDEPLSNLDAKLRVQMRLEIKKLHERLEATIIYVTHDQVEAMTLADRIAVIHEGILQQVAPPTQVYTHPSNSFVAGFIGAPTMNFILATVRFDGGKPAADAGAFRLPIADETGVLKAFEGKEVHLGIRPEHIRLSPQDPVRDLQIPFQAEVIEPLGSSVAVFGKSGDRPLSAMLPAGVSVRAHEELSLFVNTDELKVFDIDSGKGILI